MNPTIENDIEKYQELKIELLKLSKLIECCEEAQIEYYQDLCIKLAGDLRKMKILIEQTYGMKICKSCI